MNATAMLDEHVGPELRPNGLAACRREGGDRYEFRLVERTWAQITRPVEVAVSA